MSSLRTAVATAACAGLLAACHKPAPPAAASGQATSPSASAPVDQASLPHPRAGQWEITDNSHGAGFHNTVCVTDRPFDIGKAKAACQSFVYHRVPGGIAIDAQCGKGPISSTMHITAQGDFNSAYSTDTRLSFTLRPGDTPHVTETHMDYRYLGPCPAADQARAEHEDKGE